MVYLLKLVPPSGKTSASSVNYGGRPNYQNTKRRNTKYLMLITEDTKCCTVGKCLSQTQKQYGKWVLNTYGERRKMPCAEERVSKNGLKL